MASKKAYKVDCDCSNCDKAVSVELPKGTPVGQNMECPSCGCMTASKRVDFNFPTIPKTEPYRYPPVQPFIAPVEWDRRPTATLDRFRIAQGDYLMN